MILHLKSHFTQKKITLNITNNMTNHGSKSGHSKSPAIFTWLDHYRFDKIYYSRFSTSFFNA